jgi:hypothetical protein
MEYNTAMKTILLTLTVLAIFLVSTGGVFAEFAVSTPYWNNNPLEMYPGESKEVQFNLQNCPALLESCDSGDIIVTAEFEEGNEIAEVMSGLEYSVPYGTANTNLLLRVSIPESAKIGESYNIKFSLSSPPEPQEGGNVQLGIVYGVSFPVKVVEKPVVEGEEVEGPNYLLWVIIALIIILLIIIVIILRKKREEAVIK